MAVWAFAWANGNSMHLLSDVEKGIRSVPAITVSSSTDKLSSGIKGLTSSLAVYSLVLKSLTPLTNGARADLEVSVTYKRSVKPCFQRSDVTKPCYKLLPVLSELWHWWTPLYCGLPPHFSTWKYLSTTNLTSPTFSLSASSLFLLHLISLLLSSSSSHQEDGARGSLWYKLGQAGPCEAELCYAVHSGALSLGIWSKPPGAPAPVPA